MKIKDYSMILEIEQKREEMYKSIAKNGITHQNTLQISQELDRLLNIIQKHEISTRATYRKIK